MKPTDRPQDNPHKPGDVVTITHDSMTNGAGEGSLWRIVEVRGPLIKIEEIWTATGQPSGFSPCRVLYHQIDAVDIVRLGSQYAQLGNIIKELATMRGMDPGTG